MESNNNNKKIPITIPSNTSEKRNIIKNLNKVIKEQIEVISRYQDIEISESNQEEIQEVLISSDSLIKDCHVSKEYKCNINDEFSVLTYEFQRLSLKYESYKIKALVKSMEIRELELSRKQKELEKKYDKTTQESNNLIYNILGFIASYSIVSAAVTTFEKVNSMEDIIIFMTFIAFILITTLIGLNNFYKINDKDQKGLKNNYFLWKALICVFVGLIMYKGVIFVKRNIDTISYNIGKGIENIKQNEDNKEKNTNENWVDIKLNKK